MPCDTRSQQPTYTFAQAVTHTHTHTHTHPLLCPRALLFPQSGSQVTFTAIWRRNLFWMTKRVHRHTQIVRGDGSTRSGGTRAVRPHGAAIAAGGPGSCTAFPCLHPISHTLTAPLSLRPLPLCHNVGARRMWSAGMVFRHKDTMMATRL